MELFLFEITPMRIEDYTTQVASALEKRTELLSRKEYPALWKKTDRLNDKQRKPTEPAKQSNKTSSSKFLSILVIALGIFLLIPGLMQPKELLGPLIIGVVSVLWGMLRLFGNRKNEKPLKSRFEKSAKLLLAGKDEIREGQFRIEFSEECMRMRECEKNENEDVAYTAFEAVIETADTFVLTFGTRAIVLLKKDLLVGSVSDFSQFIMGKVEIKAVL